MNRTACYSLSAMILISGWVGTASAAELSDTMPAGTLLYIGWPGADAFGAASKDTAWGRLMAEPEIARSRTRWHEEIWPAIDRLIRENLGQNPQGKAYEPAVNLLSAAWQYPAALGFAGVDMTPDGPKADLALVIRAGADSKKLADDVETIFQVALGPNFESREVKIGSANLRAAKLPQVGLPLHYGVLGDDVVVSVGTKFPAHWEASAAASDGKTAFLTASERFATAMKTTGGSGATPVFFVDLRGVIETLEKFQPMFASAKAPILGEPGGVQKLLDGIGLGTIQSFSAAVRPDGGGFTTTTFLHAPNLGPGAGELFAHKPLTEDNLKLVPRDVTFAAVTNMDLPAAYRSVLSAVKAVSPETYQQLQGKIDELEKQVGVRIEQDLLGSFADTWAFYDAPGNGGFWFTGILAIAELREGNKLDESLDKIVKAISDAVGEKYPVTVREETYRDHKIRFVNVASAPIPLAPAWATVERHWVFGLYPQMVRAGVDQLMDKGPTLLDNVDFQNGRKFVPAQFSSISYTDTRGGFRLLYSLAVPVGTALMDLAQGQKIPMDASLLPSSKTITKHLSGNVSASVTTKEGLLSVSHGAIPIPIPSVSAGGSVATTSMLVSILLPSLARAREQAKRTVDMSNLKQIAMACAMYSAKHQGRLPPDLETLVKKDGQGYLPKPVLKSPRDCSGADVSYVYVKGLSAKMPQAGQVVLAYENPDLVDTSEGINVAFLDGHVERMSKRTFEQRLDETKELIKEQAGSPEGEKQGKEEKQER